MTKAIICFIVTIGLYCVAKWGYKRTGKVYLSPIIIVPTLLILMLVYADIPLTTYRAGNKVLIDLLEPATIAFAIPLYKYFDVLKKYALVIIASVLSGSLISLVSTALIAGWVHLNSQMVHSLVPRSITTPIAMGLSEQIGGSPSITAAIVIITGLFGSIVGPFIIRKLKIHNEISRGVLLGTGAHALGTTKAFEVSSKAGAISSVSMILAAMFTFGITPWLVTFIR